MEELLKKLFAPKPTSGMSGFRFADLFDNNRWETMSKVMEDVAPKRQGDDVFYRQYVPRPSAASVVTSSPSISGWVHGQGISDPGAPTVTYDSAWSGADRRHYERNQGTTVKTVTSPDGGVTTTETTKYLPPERRADMRRLESGFTPARFMPSTFAEEGPGMGSYAPWSDRAGARPPMEFGPTRTTGNPFGYPMHTAIQGPPRYTDVYQEMPGAQYSMRYTTDEDGPGQRSIPQSYGPPGQLRHNMGTVGAVNSPFDRRTSEQTFAYNMVPLVRPEITPITTQSVPQGNRIPLSYNQQSQLNRFPYSGMAPMSDADKIRMLELLLIGRDD